MQIILRNTGISRKGRQAPWILLAAFCLAAFLSMAYASSQESATMDELAHIPAGYSYVSELDFRLNPEHPPLVKAIAAFPLVFLDPHFPVEHPAWTKAVNGQWDMGAEFLYRSRNNAVRLLQLARVGPMLLTLLLIVMTYVVARRRLGSWWALLPAFLVAVSPTILAHGHYVTTDVGAAFGALLGIHFFVRFLEEQSWKNVIFAGLALGIAESLKFSMILLLPLFGVLAAIHWWLWRGPIWRRLRDLVLVGLIGYLVIIYPMYAVFTANYPAERQVADSAAILEGLRQNACALIHPLACLAEADMWMAGHAVTRPLAEYLLGLLMVIQRADGGNTAYFLGKVSNAGSPWYFPVAYAAKESLPALLFVLLSFAGSLALGARRLARPERLQALRNVMRRDFGGVAMLLFIALYWYTSVRSPLNIGFRHILPVIPPMYILAAGWWRSWALGPFATGDLPRGIFALLHGLFRSWIRLSFLAFLVIWALLEMAFAAPYFPSYYNQLAGGTREGYRIAVDSNYDWGQDLVRLAAWAKEHPEAGRIAVDYFGGGNPAYYLGERAEGWWSARGNPAEDGLQWLAVSVGFLENATQPAAPGFVRQPEDEYRWLVDLKGREPGMGGLPKPDLRAGTSIFLYEL